MYYNKQIIMSMIKQFSFKYLHLLSTIENILKKCVLYFSGALIKKWLTYELV